MPINNQRGFGVFAIISAMALIGTIAFIASSIVYPMISISQRSNLNQATGQIITQAAYTLTTEANTSGSYPVATAPTAWSGTNPTTAPTIGTANAVGLIPTTSAAPKVDAWGSNFGYCTFTAASQADPVFAIISAGADKTFQTTCTQAFTGTTSGDDGVRFKTVANVKQGVGGTVYFGDPVANVAALNALTSVRAGEMRVTTDTGTVYVNKTGVSGAWTTASASGGGSSVTTITEQVTTLTSGSGTYTVPANTQYLTVEMVGGGGGGATGGLSRLQHGGNGGTTIFRDGVAVNLVANGGSGGGTGGSASITGAQGVALNGGHSGGFTAYYAANFGTGGTGASTPFGAGGMGNANANGNAAPANTGAGGGGGGTVAIGTGQLLYAGMGGGAGGYVKATITTLNPTYTYTIGGGGAGDTGQAGYAYFSGAGASGIIVVTAHILTTANITAANTLVPTSYFSESTGTIPDAINSPAYGGAGTNTMQDIPGLTNTFTMATSGNVTISMSQMLRTGGTVSTCHNGFGASINGVQQGNTTWGFNIIMQVADAAWWKSGSFTFTRNLPAGTYTIKGIASAWSGQAGTCVPCAEYTGNAIGFDYAKCRMNIRID